MRVRCSLTILILLAASAVDLLAAAVNLTPVVVRVDPSATAAPGADSTVDALHVVRTIGEAATAVASVLAAGSRDVSVELQVGSHRVPQGGLLLTHEHTPAETRHTVTWRCVHGAGSCSVHGGTVLTGWKVCAASATHCPAGTMVAPLPTELKGRQLRHLYVDGLRANRTRTDAAQFDLAFAAGTDQGGPPAPAMPNTSKAMGYVAKSGDLGGWQTNPGDIELVYSSVAANWGEARCALASVTGDTMIVKQPCMYNLYHRPWQPAKDTPPPYVDNIRTELRSPGQVYFDRAAGQVYYVPLPGQDMTQAATIVAVEEQLVFHNGTAQHSWHGVTFEYATWLRPMQGDGFVEQQSAACNVCPMGASSGQPPFAPYCGEGDVYVMTPANVAVAAGKYITFDSCTFQHLGAYGSGASKGSQHVNWENCTFTDLSGGAILLGGLDTCDEKDTTKWDQAFHIADNKILNLPVEYTGATAVFFGYVENATLEHNWMENMTYSAMTIGWGWGRTACGRGNNHVLANKIVNPLRTRCCDGGEVYTLGPQPGSSIERNHLVNHGKFVGHGQSSYAQYPNPVYHDNGSGGFTDRNNVIEGAWEHYCGENPPQGGNPKFCNTTCPDSCGEEAQCNISFTENWLYKSTFAKQEQCSKFSTVSGNVNVTAGEQLPAQAQAVIAAAGPRK